MDVSDRRLHVQLTQEAKIASDFSLFRAIFAFAGFVSALSRGGLCARPGERGCFVGYSTVMVFVRPQTEISCTPASSVNSIVTMRNWPASSAMNFEAINSSPS